jgi:hypothetical protein
MKGVKGKPPVMLFVAIAVALFAIVQLGSYVKAHGGIIPKPKVSQANEVKNEKRPSFFGSPSSSGSSGFSPPSSVSGSSPSYSYPYSYPSVSSSPPSGFSSSPSASPPAGGSVGGYGYIVIEVARPSDRQSVSSGLDLPSGLKVIEIP